MTDEAKNYWDVTEKEWDEAGMLAEGWAGGEITGLEQRKFAVDGEEIRVLQVQAEIRVRFSFGENGDQPATSNVLEDPEVARINLRKDSRGIAKAKRLYKSAMGVEAAKVTDPTTGQTRDQNLLAMLTPIVGQQIFFKIGRFTPRGSADPVQSISGFRQTPPEKP